MQASEKKLTAQNLMQTIELRIRYQNIKSLEGREFRDALSEIEQEAHEVNVPCHLILMDNDSIFLEIVKKSNLKPIYEGCLEAVLDTYHAVESFQFQTSK